MKQLFAILLLTLTLFGAKVDEFATEMGFERNYNTALAKAKKEDKVLMMVLGADYCPWCRKFERKTLQAPSISDFVKKEFITLVVDKKFDKESFPEAFQTMMTPKVFFINPNSQKSFFDTTGYVKKKEFLKKIQNVKKLYKEQ